MLLDSNANILVQGITGREATMMVADMIDYGSRIVAGVSPGKSGERVNGVPVYDTVKQAGRDHRFEISVISVPPPTVLDAALEAIAHGVLLCLIMTERVPVQDTCKILCAATATGCRIIGPNSLGLIRPGVAKLGTIGGRIDNTVRSYTPGHVAILSRSGGMTTEIADFLSRHGIGQSIAVGVGGDRIVGSNFVELAQLLEDDPETDTVLIYGEPGGTAEESLADYLMTCKSRLRFVAYLSGRFVDELEGLRFGHAAVIVERGQGSVKQKMERLRMAGVYVAESFDDILRGVQQ